KGTCVGFCDPVRLTRPTLLRIDMSGTRSSFSRRERSARSLDQHAESRAHVRPIVPDREMLRAAIVPESDGMIRPAEANLPMRLFHVVEEKRKHRIALVSRQLVDVGGEPAIDEDELAP